MPDDSYLRLKTVVARSGLSRATIYRRMAAGTFPQRVPIGPKSVGWRASDFEKWFEAPDRVQ